MRRTNTFTRKQVLRAVDKRRAKKKLTNRERVMCEAYDKAASRLSS